MQADRQTGRLDRQTYRQTVVRTGRQADRDRQTDRQAGRYEALAGGSADEQLLEVPF